MCRDCVSIRIFSHPFYFLLTPSCLPSVSLCLCVSKSARGYVNGALLRHSTPLHARDSHGKPCAWVDVDTSC